MKRLRDWWRGYTDADIASVEAKLSVDPAGPGRVTWVTDAEMRALRDIPQLEPPWLGEEDPQRHLVFRTLFGGALR